MVSSATLATPSIPKKNQIANGMEAKLPCQPCGKELDEKTLEEYCNMYFRIPLEQNATQWGIDFAMTHQELMKKYDWLHN